MLNPLKKLRSKQEEWCLKTPKEKWQMIFDVANVLCRPIGVRVFSDMKNYWYSYTCGVVTFIYFLLAAYTIQHYWRQGEYLRGMECTCGIGIIVSSISMYWHSIDSYRFKLNGLFTFGGDYIYMNDKRPSKYKALCEESVEKLVRSTITVVVLIIFSHKIFAIGTIYAYFFKNIRLTPLATELPYIDSESDIGFALNLMQQSIPIFCELMGTLAVEIGQSLINNVITTFPKLIRFDLDDLSNELELEGMGVKTKMRLRNVLIKIQDFDRYLQNIIDVYSIKLFIGIVLFVYSISFSIFVQLVFDFLAGYGIALCNYVSLLIICYMGNNVKDANENIALELYNMPWYQLSVSEQKQISATIHRLQNGSVLSIGPFAQLDFETAANLTQRIYKFTMMLLTKFK